MLFLHVTTLITCDEEEHEHGENCGCPLHKKKQQQQIPQYIKDPTDNIPPEVCSKGKLRYIPDPASSKPDYWDDDDDGAWEAELIVNPDYTWTQRMIPNPKYIPPNKLSMYIHTIKDNVEEAIPWVTLGIIVVSIFELVPLPINFLRSQLSGEGSMLLNSMKAGMLGLATPLCSCGSLPIALGLIEYGIPLSSVVTFLTASQSAGIDSALITYGLLGPAAAIFRLLGALILSIVCGLVLQSTTSSSSSSTSKKEESKQKLIEEKTTNTSSNSIMTRFILTLIDTTIDIFPLALSGIVISTAAMQFLPMIFSTPIQTIKESDSPMINNNDLILRIIVIVSALPLQLCEHTTAALASGITKSGVDGSSGLAFAFLLSAPATNLPSLLLLAKKKRGNNDNHASNSYYYAPLKVALSLVITALLLSYVVDFLHIDLGVDKAVMGDMDILPKVFVDYSSYISGFLLVCGILRAVKSKLFDKEESDSCCHSSATSCEKKLN